MNDQFHGQNRLLSIPGVTPEPPFMWPEPRVFEHQVPYAHTPPFDQVAEASSSMFGIISDLEGQVSRNWLDALFQRNAELQVRLVLALYPACATWQQDLGELLALQNRLAGRLHVRLLPLEQGRGKPVDTLCCFHKAQQQPYLLSGPSANLGFWPFRPDQVNLVFRCDAVLLQSLTQWFDWLWLKYTVPLDARTVDIPFLVPAEGTREAAEAWRHYLRECQSAKDNTADPQHPAKPIVTVDPDTGRISTKTEGGHDVKPPSVELTLPALDPIGEHIARLYEVGSMVTIDKESRLPPLDAPIKPEWFGVKSFREFGRGKRQISYRISVLDGETLRELENRRNDLRKLLDRLSFPLAESLRWIPHNAKPLLEQELHRVNEQATQRLQALLKGDPTKFVETQRKQIEDDANAMYQEFHPGVKLSDEIISYILQELATRLAKASGGRLLPQVNYAQVSFTNANNGKWVNNWGQPLTLLRAVAEYPRKVFSDQYFLRGLALDESDLLAAMNVCNDVIVQAAHDRQVWKRAKEELGWIDQIVESSAEARTKCQALVNLMKGIPWAEIHKPLDGAKTEAPA